MEPVTEHIGEVKEPRDRPVSAVDGLPTGRGAFNAAPDRWSVQEVIEHLVLAEQAGINRV